jgi:hypothetical protein
VYQKVKPLFCSGRIASKLMAKHTSLLTKNIIRGSIFRAPYYFLRGAVRCGARSRSLNVMPWLIQSGDLEHNIRTYDSKSIVCREASELTMWLVLRYHDWIALSREPFFLRIAICLRGLKHWYLVLGGVAVGRGFKPVRPGTFLC